MVRYWMWKGYDHDPRTEINERIRKAEFQDVIGFYNRMVKDRPVVIMMSGPKKVSTKELAKYGKVTKLKYKQIFKE